MKVYASISGGKDSLAALITHIERGGQCDGAIYCRIMFDDETSAEVPEHEEWLHSKCFPLLEREHELRGKAEERCVKMNGQVTDARLMVEAQARTVDDLRQQLSFLRQAMQDAGV